MLLDPVMHSRGGGRGQGVFWPSSTPKIIAAWRSKYDNKIFLLFLDEDEELSEHSDESVLCVKTREIGFARRLSVLETTLRDRKGGRPLIQAPYAFVLRTLTVQEWMISLAPFPRDKA